MNSANAAQAGVTTSPALPPRLWTQAEQSKLFDDYFARLPGSCPVCTCTVGMMIEHKPNVAVLTMRCPGCRNTAKVTRPQQG